MGMDRLCWCRVWRLVVWAKMSVKALWGAPAPVGAQSAGSKVGLGVAGLTQEELSERVGIGVAYLSRLENGHRGARWHTVMRLLRALNATLADLGDAIDKQSSEG